MDSPPIGIDLGTTNSAVAVFRGGAPELLPNAHGQFLTPSIVGVLDSGEVIVGAAAAELAVVAPERCAATFKRWMGEDKQVELAGQTFTPPELSAIVLRSLKADAEAALGPGIQGAVITVPAYFDQVQREATRRAGELAGLEVRRIVNEPTAAALTYGFHQRSADRRLLVFDLGGGTFDVTIMEIFEGVLEIQATAGESRLGGEDFTDLLLGRALRRMDRSLEVAEFREPKLVARLRSEAETAKRIFSSSDSALLRLPETDGTVDPAGPTWDLGAAEFEELCEPLLERLRRPVLRALRDADLSPERVDQVLLVGGASRMPVVRRLVTELFGRPPRHEIDPDQAVALGAAVQAALVADDAAVEDLVATDVCPHTLGVEISKEMGTRVVHGYYFPILHRNTTIPVSTEESVYTMHDNQEIISVRVYQGEGRRVEDNTYLGELEVPDLPAHKSGLEVCLRFTYDQSGLLEVEAFVPSTGKKTSTIFRHHAKALGDGELKAAAKRMQGLKFYPREDLGHQRLLRYAERCLPELARFQREQLEEHVDAFDRALHHSSPESFEDARRSLLNSLSALGLAFDGAEESEEPGDGEV